MNDEDWNISLKFLANKDGSLNVATVRQMFQRLYDEIAELKRRERRADKVVTE